MSLFYCYTRLLFLIIFKVFYRLEVKGVENVPAGKAIIASNHVSYYDPPIVAVSCPDELSFLAIRGLFANRIFAFIIRHLNAYPVSGRLRDLSSIKMVCRLLDQNRKVLIFPEGGRTVDGVIRQVKRGAAFIARRTQAPIVPVYIKGAFDVWPITKFLPCLFGRITCAFGAPIYPENFRHLDKKNATEKLSTAILDALKELEKQS